MSNFHSASTHMKQKKPNNLVFEDVISVMFSAWCPYTAASILLSVVLLQITCELLTLYKYLLHSIRY